MNGLREHRQAVANELADARFKAIETKLDAILAVLKGETTKAAKDAVGKVVSTLPEPEPLAKK
jgi:hypothetical protein